MSSRKQRLTVTVDPELIAAGRHAVAVGAAASISSWVGEALDEKRQRDQKLELLRAAVSDYEREFGAITPEETAEQKRSDREAATIIRGRARPASKAARSA
ncbi:MAG: hypothetical protein JST73_03335 [Actinobacteria bacterium]|nr:hypothetical protein [Actinomycetota bacterium]